MDWINQASTSAQKSDAVFFYATGLSLAFLVFITVLMITFVIRYSRKRHPKASQIEGNVALEITWTVIPLVLFLTIFYFGWTNFEYTRHAPRDAMVVKVTGRQWAWSFEYPNGKQTRELYAALDKPMKLELHSLDVIHGFFVPAFRLKADVVPGRTNFTWFQANQLGSFDIECTVICGVNHSAMLSKVVVVPEDEFKAWYFGGEGAPEPGVNARAAASAAVPGDAGAVALLESKGCLACHSLDGTPRVGPTLKGLYGKQERILVDGTPHPVTVDDEHLRRSILEPAREIVAGYPPVMPTAPMSPQEVTDAVSFIENLKGN
jgi:cytochrome c oxidase subunit II